MPQKPFKPTGPPFIETTYPGQTKRTIKAPRHIYEHFLKHPESELPFIEPPLASSSSGWKSTAKTGGRPATCSSGTKPGAAATAWQHRSHGDPD